MAKQVDSPAGVSVEKAKGETTERFLFPVPVENLPTKGMFYRDDIRISIKSCTVADIRDFSLIDEEDIMSVNEKLEGIISNVSVKYGRVDGSYKDLCEADKIYLLVLIKIVPYFLFLRAPSVSLFLSSLSLPLLTCFSEALSTEK